MLQMFLLEVLKVPLMGHENGIGFKVQGGYKFHLHKQFSLAGFGIFKSKTVKKEGSTLQITAFDMSFAHSFTLQVVSSLEVVLITLVSTFTRRMDNTTDENINGGDFEGLGKIGYDIIVGYDVYEKLHVFLGFSERSSKCKKEVYWILSPNSRY